MFVTDYSNELFQLAASFVQNTRHNLFLTGKAGTGKTTFLKYIKEHSQKNAVVVAPTGVAAINAGGVTIHSFFQLPFSPFIPASKGFGNTTATDKHELLGRLRFYKEKIDLLNNLDLLIIDEISMVRADTLDAIDTILRHFRQRSALPFGGVQVLFIGDMYQLPPVIPEPEWAILSSFYNSPFFFNSHVVEQHPPVYIELEKMYRQNEQSFINLLNKVRNNLMDEEGLALLHSRYRQHYVPQSEEEAIVLTTHNNKADAINTNALQRLPAKAISYKAVITGDFSEKAYPAEENLVLKEGARVMFIKNDTEKERRFFNGKTGTVKKLEEETITISCGDNNTIELKKHKWENIRYSLAKGTNKVEEEVLGSFEQFPLRLAWAITIHKSQGLTFEKAVIDAEAAFAPGQVYVALSRCTTLHGLVLSSPVNKNSLRTDERIVAFGKNKTDNALLQQHLADAAKEFHTALIKELFDFTAVLNKLQIISELTATHQRSFNEETTNWIETLTERILNQEIVLKKFHNQLHQLLLQPLLPETNIPLQERIKAAAQYFIPQWNYVIQLIKDSPAVTDSYQLAVEFNDALQDLFKEVFLLHELFTVCANGFSVQQYQQKKYTLRTPMLQNNAYAGAGFKKNNSTHPQLYTALRQLRDRICASTQQPIYLVAGSNTLDEMVNYLPQTVEELGRISGFGPAKLKKYGDQFVKIIADYSQQNGLTSLIHNKTGKRSRTTTTAVQKPDTKQESFRLFTAGKSVTEIAAERNLTSQTIEGHLAHFVKSGELDVHRLLPEDKLSIILPLLQNSDEKSLVPFKLKAGENISFGEIRLAVAWKEHMANKERI